MPSFLSAVAISRMLRVTAGHRSVPGLRFSSSQGTATYPQPSFLWKATMPFMSWRNASSGVWLETATRPISSSQALMASAVFP